MAKTKLLVTGSASDVERLPIKLQGGEIECVSEFKYLRSMESGGGVMVEVGERIAQASGALCEPIFRNCNLSLRKAVVLEFCYTDQRPGPSRELASGSWRSVVPEQF